MRADRLCRGFFQVLQSVCSSFFNAFVMLTCSQGELLAARSKVIEVVRCKTHHPSGSFQGGPRTTREFPQERWKTS